MLTPRRRAGPEWLDRDDNRVSEVEAALRDIALVNRHLGGARALLRAVAPFVAVAEPDRPLEILDVGTGGADLAMAMVMYGRRAGRRVRVTAADRDPAAASAAARTAAGVGEIRILRADALRLPFRARSFDLVTASMFLHHFPATEAARLIASLRRIARVAVVVNDLRRHLVPWAFIALGARAARRSPMFVHDAPLSVLRGFTADELRRVASEAGAAGSRVERRWPFRLVLTLPAEGSVP